MLRGVTRKFAFMLGMYNIILHAPAYSIVSLRLLVNHKTHNCILIYGDLHTEHYNSNDGVQALLSSMKNFNKRTERLLGTITCGIELPLEEPGDIWGETFTRLAPYVYQRKSLQGFSFLPWDERDVSINTVLCYTFLALQEITLTRNNATPIKYAARAMKVLKKTEKEQPLPNVSRGDFIKYLKRCTKRALLCIKELAGLVDPKPLSFLYKKYNDASEFIKNEVLAVSTKKDSLQESIVAYLRKQKRSITKKCIYELCLLFHDSFHNTFADIGFLYHLIKTQNQSTTGGVLTLCVVGERHAQQISSLLQQLGYSRDEQRSWDLDKVTTPITQTGLYESKEYFNQLISSALLAAHPRTQKETDLKAHTRKRKRKTR